MKKITLLLLVTISIAHAQVGITTTSPAATLDVTAKNTTGTTTTVDGILIPRVDRQRAQSMTSTPTSTLIYVNNATTGTATGTAVNITSNGFYYYNGTTWTRLDTPTNTNWTSTGNTGTSATTNFIGTTDGNDFVTKTNGNERMRVTSAGNVGIGTTAPTHKLTVKNDGDGVGVASIDNATAGGFAGIYFNQGSGVYKGHIGYVNTGGSSTFGGKGAYQVASGDRPMTFSTNNGSENYIERMVIAQDGRVGIGTNTTSTAPTIQPTSTLQVNGSIAVKIATVSATSTIANDVSKVIVNNGSTDITLTLPAPSTCSGRLISISRGNSTSTGVITINPGGGSIQSLDGSLAATTTIAPNTTTYIVITIPGGGVNVQFWSNGTNWYR